MGGAWVSNRPRRLSAGRSSEEHKGGAGGGEGAGAHDWRMRGGCMDVWLARGACAGVSQAVHVSGSMQELGGG